MQKAYLGSKAHAKLSEKLLGRRRIYYCGTQLPHPIMRMASLHPRRAARLCPCSAGRGGDMLLSNMTNFDTPIGLPVWVVAQSFRR